MRINNRSIQIICRKRVERRSNGLVRGIKYRVGTASVLKRLPHRIRDKISYYGSTLSSHVPIMNLGISNVFMTAYCTPLRDTYNRAKYLFCGVKKVKVSGKSALSTTELRCLPPQRLSTPEYSRFCPRHFGVTMTPTILSFIESTSALACSIVVPLSNSNPTETDLQPDTLS